MKSSAYRATLSPNQDRSSFSMIFRHPLKNGKDGKSGRRVRRGLGTNDINIANGIIEQMNELLSDESLWSPSMKDSLIHKFDKRVINAFFDDLTPELRDSWQIRDKILPLPGKNDGYTRSLLIGTTGAGKTTLLRIIIGTDPFTERFPSTSAAKTTISDIEVVTTNDDQYKAVVTFISYEKVRQLIEESVIAAMIAAVEQKSDSEIERRFLEHTEQRFRLSYLLGTTQSLSNMKLDELIDENESDEIEEEITEVGIEEDEKKILLQKLQNYLTEIKAIGNEVFYKIKEQLNFDIKNASKQEIDVFFEFMEDELYENEKFDNLIDLIIEELKSKFSLVPKGIIEREKDWSVSWVFESSDRKEFIKIINQFSSNYAPNFGRLLTPLVDGIRVSGKFECPWYNKPIKLVLMDGEGLGHTPSSFSSLSTNLTKKFSLVDSIVLVDNAAQPMQASPSAALRHLVSSGNEDKLSLCFTHFDEVVGPNLTDNLMRKNHVLSSIDNAITAITKDLGKRAENSLKDIALKRVFYLSNIQKELNPKKKFTISELNSLLNSIESTTQPKDISEVGPQYDLASIVLGIQSALREFHNYWRAKIGLIKTSEIEIEHWTRIKALTRRLGLLGIDEYNSLKPVADLIKSLREHIYKILSNPIGFTSKTASDEMQNESIRQIASEIDNTLHAIIPEILFRSKIPDWYKAFILRGPGSTYVRAQSIKTIYDSSAPIPEEIPSIDSNKFATELRIKLIEKINNLGGKVI